MTTEQIPNIDDPSFPVLAEAQANLILDELVQSVIQLKDDNGSDLAYSTPDKLLAVFGERGQMVAQMIMFAAARGFEFGVVEKVPGSDRTDVLVSVLQDVHVREQFGYCQEDGEPWPCRSHRALTLVAGGEPQVDRDEPDVVGA